MSTRGGAGYGWERLRDGEEMRKGEEEGLEEKGGSRGPLGEPALEDEAGVAVGSAHTNSPCDLRSPDSLRFVCDPRGRDGDRVSNLDIGSPLPKTHCIQDAGQPLPWPRSLPTGWRWVGEGLG